MELFGRGLDMIKADIYQFIAKQKLGVLGTLTSGANAAVGPRGNRRDSRIGDHLRYRQEFAQVSESDVEFPIVRSWLGGQTKSRCSTRAKCANPRQPRLRTTRKYISLDGQNAAAT